MVDELREVLVLIHPKSYPLSVKQYSHQCLGTVPYWKGSAVGRQDEGSLRRRFAWPYFRKRSHEAVGSLCNADASICYLSYCKGSAVARQDEVPLEAGSPGRIFENGPLMLWSPSALQMRSMYTFYSSHSSPDTSVKSNPRLALSLRRTSRVLSPISCFSFFTTASISGLSASVATSFIKLFMPCQDV